MNSEPYARPALLDEWHLNKHTQVPKCTASEEKSLYNIQPFGIIPMGVKCYRSIFIQPTVSAFLMNEAERETETEKASERNKTRARQKKKPFLLKAFERLYAPKCDRHAKGVLMRTAWMDITETWWTPCGSRPAGFSAMTADVISLTLAGRNTKTTTPPLPNGNGAYEEPPIPPPSPSSSVPRSLPAWQGLRSFILQLPPQTSWINSIWMTGAPEQYDMPLFLSIKKCPRLCM